MAWTFVIDSENQKSLSKSLNEKANSYDNKINQLYKTIDDCGNDWIGEDYDTFKVGTHGYEKALKDQGEGIRLYAKHFERMSDTTIELANELAEIINNATGRTN